MPRQAVPHLPMAVALRKESVDRNVWRGLGQRPRLASLSARRAWIEMPPGLAACARCTVALRKESVDRNNPGRAARPRPDTSLSARRAWIEIHMGVASCVLSRVALRKESVDRNVSVKPQKMA